MLLRAANETSSKSNLKGQTQVDHSLVLVVSSASMAGKAGLVDTAKPNTEGLGHGVLTETEVHDVAVPERKHYEIPLEERMYYATIQRWTYLREKDNNSYKGENTWVYLSSYERSF